MPDRRRTSATVTMELDVLRQQRFELREVAALGGREEALSQPLPLLLRGLEARTLVVYVAPCARGELARVLLAGADDLGDPPVLVAEHVLQGDGGALFRSEGLEDNQEGERQRVGQFGLLGGVVRRALGDWLGQPLPDVGLPSRAGRAQLVDREPRGDRGDIGTGGGDLFPSLERG